MRIVLASASPRRRELLEQIGLQFDIVVSNVAEETDAVTPEELVEVLSRRKAEAVLAQLPSFGEPVLVIGADTVVALGENILGKPGDEGEAVEMLKKLSGGRHQVCTGVTLLYRQGISDGPATVKLRTFHEKTKVHFYPMTPEEIAAYVSTGDPLDKAGAYGIQGVFARYLQGIEGDYNNVVGLPVARLYQEAKEWLEA